ncbi:uncharacterized protein LOC109010310 [Juglans regia]|uniref:Uncharacterized protein LOC109010310 n=2 Tax=Juglans regia TaxID=51240 RepID=A0A2I4GRW3_JUGRE|nr:uncharacterized protein LOC109010310 [Juglans regia]
MEIVIPPTTMDFDFNNSNSRPSSLYMSAPSTPKRFGEFYFSAPTSPSRGVSEFYRDEFPMQNESRAGGTREEAAGEFAFDFCEELERSSLPADELFDGGKIRPFKPPSRLQIGRKAEAYTTPSSPFLLSPKSPRSQGKKTFLGVFSGRRKKDSDPFAIELENTRRKTEHERGRERSTDISSSNSGRRASRSLSPFRVFESPWEEQEKTQQNTKQPSLNSKASFSSTAASSSSSSKSSSKKWSLKDFLLFRSASEGRATDRDPFLKFSPALHKRHEDFKNSSFRSPDTSGSVGRSRRGPVSAHELHYTVNKAVSEDLKKKTFLPYKQGILGRLAFNPAVHALANGFGSFTRS